MSTYKTLSSNSNQLFHIGHTYDPARTEQMCHPCDCTTYEEPHCGCDPHEECGHLPTDLKTLEQCFDNVRHGCKSGGIKYTPGFQDISVGRCDPSIDPNCYPCSIESCLEVFRLRGDDVCTSGHNSVCDHCDEGHPQQHCPSVARIWNDTVRNPLPSAGANDGDSTVTTVKLESNNPVLSGIGEAIPVVARRHSDCIVPGGGVGAGISTGLRPPKPVLITTKKESSYSYLPFIIAALLALGLIGPLLWHKKKFRVELPPCD